MSRGRRSEEIFYADADREEFLRVLREAGELWDLRISAYCLMPNHYHLLVQTPNGNLSRCMRHINGVYTQRFNRQNKKEVQLFRGRYKAVLVDKVISVVCAHYNVSKQEMLHSRRGTENIARDIAIYLGRRLCCKALPKVGAEFGINNYSTVSSVVQRMKKRIEKDRTLQKELKIIEGETRKSQKRT